MAATGGRSAGRGERAPAVTADGATHQQLLDHAARTTVALCPPPGAAPARLWGSGVLIAPGWVLTCAHVLTASDGRHRATGADGTIGVVVGGRVAAARLEYDLARPDPAAGPSAARPDLALVRLLDLGLAHPCAWLSDQPTTLLTDAYIFRGHRDPGAGATRDIREAAGRGVAAPTLPASPAPPDAFLAVRFGARDARGLQFASDVRVTPGASGGPLLECDRGEVVGIVKASRQEDRLGLAVPVAALRGLGPEHLVAGATGLGADPYHALMSLHDRWHWAGQELGREGGPTWFDAQHTIMAGRGRLWGVQERLQALDLLARLPAPRDPLAVEAAVGEVLDRGDAPGARQLRTWRDGHGELYQGRDPYAELRSFVHYLRIVAQQTADEAHDMQGEEAAAVREEVARLEEFVQAKAVVLQLRDRRRIGPVRRRPRSVLVEFEPLFYDEGGPELFNWSVSEGYGRGRWLRVDVQESAGGVPFEQAREQVLRGLGARLLRADRDAGPGARVRLEVAVPEGRWHTAAGDWEVAASTRSSSRVRRVGPGRPVILRDQGRREEVDPAWLRRWQGLTAAAELRALRVEAPARSGAAASDALWRVLEAADGGALPALCHAVADGFGRDAVGTALDTGFPAGLWPATGHGARACDAECEEFHRGVRELLKEAVHVARLPELVRELRVKAAEEGAHWARDLVLLYDDPEDPIPQLFADVPQVSPR